MRSSREVTWEAITWPMRRGLTSAADWDKLQKLAALTNEPLISLNRNRSGDFWNGGSASCGTETASTVEYRFKLSDSVICTVASGSSRHRVPGAETFNTMLPNVSS